METIADFLRVGAAAEDSSLDSGSTRIPGWSSSEDSSLSSIETMSNKVIINGEEVEVNTSATRSEDVETALFKKEDREGMGAEKRQELFSKAATSTPAKFDLLSANITDVKQLEECYNLNLLVSRLKSQHIMYDMHDVFTIVVPDGTGPNLKTNTTPKDLYLFYADLSEEEVAASNEWYSTWPSKSWYRENLMLTAKQLEASMKNSLWTKVYERYKRYKTEQQGGPLLFVIMMKLLVTHTEQATKNLVDTVENLKISKVRGENVSKIVSLILGAHERLEAISNVPDDFSKTVLKVLQTSSVDQFNKVFELIESQARIAGALTRSTPSTQAQFQIPSVEALLDLAEQEYLSLCRSNDWTGSKTRGSPSTFTAGGLTADSGGSRKWKPVCWNCGGEHTIKDCPKPKNEALIEANRQKYQAKKKAGAGNGNGDRNRSSNKWRPPSSDENGKRIIDGKTMHWDATTKRWNKPQGNVANDQAAPATDSSTSTSQVRFAGATANVAATGSAATTHAQSRRVLERTLESLMTQVQNLS